MYATRLHNTHGQSRSLSFGYQRGGSVKTVTINSNRVDIIYFIRQHYVSLLADNTCVNVKYSNDTQMHVYRMIILTGNIRYPENCSENYLTC